MGVWGSSRSPPSTDPEPRRPIGSSRGAHAAHTHTHTHTHVHTPPRAPCTPPARSPSPLHFAISIWTLYASGRGGEETLTLIHDTSFFILNFNNNNGIIKGQTTGLQKPSALPLPPPLCAGICMEAPIAVHNHEQCMSPAAWPAVPEQSSAGDGQNSLPECPPDPPPLQKDEIK